MHNVKNISQKKSFHIIFFLFSFLFIILIISCNTQSAAESRLAPPRSVKDLRIDDIGRYVGEDPAMAIHLLEVYEIIYGPGSVFPDGPEVRIMLQHLREEAEANLMSARIRAVEEERWAEAASLARSLSSLGINVESAGEEPDIVLNHARVLLSQGDNVSAFLAAAQAHELRPLGYHDALLFLERAVEINQRRSAVFFLDAIEAISGNPGVPERLSTYARGRDTASDMIKGVATVLVDRGLRVERGRGIPDRVLGSAFFIDASGLLITNYHVISSEVDPSFRGNSRLYIRMGDNTSHRIPARVIGWDKTLDLALIKTEITPEYVFSIIDWAVPEVSETIYAIGSPVGLERTVTQGIVSALGRRPRGLLQIGDVIQIDAAVNVGNSGGPVVDMDGRLVGVVFAGIQLYEGLNFAIPAARLAAALPAMMAGGRAERPWLGLSLAESSEGVEIIYVAPSTPAADQQIPEGSIIRSINGETARGLQGMLIPALQDMLFPLSPGELIILEIADPQENIVEYTIRLAGRPELPMAEAARRDTRERMAVPLYGLVLSPRASGGLFSPTYQVRRVIRGSIADEAGFSENDPVSIRNFRVYERDGYTLLEINATMRRMGFIQTSMSLPALLDTPDTL